MSVTSRCGERRGEGEKEKRNRRAPDGWPKTHPPLSFPLSGLDAVRGSVRVYLEAYTSILLVGKEKLVRVLLCVDGRAKKREDTKTIHSHHPIPPLSTPTGSALRQGSHRGRPGDGGERECDLFLVCVWGV